MSRRTPPAAYRLISIPWLRLRFGGDRPVRDVQWVRRDAEHVVELGAGAGFYTAHLAAHLPHDTTVSAVDPDEAAVVGLRRAAHGRYVALCATGEDLPFSDESVDAVLCSYSLEQFDDPDAGLREIARILRPGGQLVLFLWRANATGCRRALRSPGLRDFRLVRARRGLQNIRLDYRRTEAGRRDGSS